MFTLSNRTISYALLAVLVVILGLFSINAFAASPSSPDAAALLQQAKEARTAAHKVVCAKLGTYTADCFSGDVEACQKLDKGTAYYGNEFGGFSYLIDCRADTSTKSFQ